MNESKSKMKIRSSRDAIRLRRSSRADPAGWLLGLNASKIVAEACADNEGKIVVEIPRRVA